MSQGWDACSLNELLMAAEGHVHRAAAAPDGVPAMPGKGGGAGSRGGLPCQPRAGRPGTMATAGPA